MKGMLVFIYKSGEGDFTAGGITSQTTEAMLIGPMNRTQRGKYEGILDIVVPGISEVRGDRAVLRIEQEQFSFGTFWRAVPALDKDWPKFGGLPQFGGNFIHASDSRFFEHEIPQHEYAAAADDKSCKLCGRVRLARFANHIEEGVCRNCGQAIEPSGGNYYRYTHKDANQTACHRAEPAEAA